MQMDRQVLRGWGCGVLRGRWVDKEMGVHLTIGIYEMRHFGLCVGG